MLRVNTVRPTRFGTEDLLAQGEAPGNKALYTQEELLEFLTDYDMKYTTWGFCGQ